MRTNTAEQVIGYAGPNSAFNTEVSEHSEVAKRRFAEGAISSSSRIRGGWKK